MKKIIWTNFEIIRKKVLIDEIHDTEKHSDFYLYLEKCILILFFFLTYVTLQCINTCHFLKKEDLLVQQCKF